MKIEEENKYSLERSQIIYKESILSKKIELKDKINNNIITNRQFINNLNISLDMTGIQLNNQPSNSNTLILII